MSATEHRECIGGPMDGQVLPMVGKRRLMVHYRSDLHNHYAIAVDDEREVSSDLQISASGRYVRFPLVRGTDPHPDALRWIPYT